MQSTAPEALLFDLGGVLVDIDFGRALEAWSAFSVLSQDELKHAFKLDAAHERLARGEITAREYFAHLRSTLKLSADLEEIERGWNAVFIGEIAQTRRLVERAHRSLPCYLFTNTNASHMTCWSAMCPRVVATIDRIFASHQMGLRKPERAAFDYICQALDTAPQSILFFDDLPENVQAGREAGLQSVLVRTPQDVADALCAAAVVSR